MPLECTVRLCAVKPALSEAVGMQRLCSNASRRSCMVVVSALLLLLCCCLHSPLIAAALSVQRATLRTHVVGGHSAPSSSDHASHAFAAAKVAVLDIHFDDDSGAMFVERALNSSVGERVEMGEVDDSAQLYGLARIICGSNLIESHPPRIAATGQTSAIAPDWVVFEPPSSEGRSRFAERWPLLALLPLPALPAPPARSLRGFFSLSSLLGSGGGAWVPSIEGSLGRGGCELRLLEPASQTWSPKGRFVSGDKGEGLVQRVAIDVVLPETSARPPPTQRLSPAMVRSLVHSLRPARSAAAPEQQFLQTFTRSRAGVGFAPIVKGLITGLLSAAAKPMGSAVADFTAAAIVDPVADKVMDGLVDALQQGMATYITSDVAVAVVPGVCETVTAAVTESIAKAIANEVVRGTVDLVATDVATRVTHTIVGPVTLRSSQLVSVDLARRLHDSLGHVLAKSVPHIVVPALINTVSVGLKEDYYCYFCNAHKVYCLYCDKNRAETANRLYYGLYYTGYHTAYYSDWSTAYSKQSKFGVLLVQKRQLNPLDEVDDDDEHAWDVKGREAIDGTQAQPEKPAKVIKAKKAK